MNVSLGCIPEYPTASSFMYEDILGGSENSEILPETFLINVPYSHYQNGIDCCVASACSVAKSVQEKVRLSPRVVWSIAKKWENYKGYGTYITKVLKGMSIFGDPVYGSVDEDIHMGREKYMRVYMTDELRGKSKPNKIKSYWWINNFDLDTQYKALVQEKVPLILAMPWFKEFYRLKTGFLPEPKTFSAYHAVIFKGRLKDDKGYYRVYQNSHGKDWGDNGDFYIYESDLYKYNLGTHFVMTDEHLTYFPTEEKVTLYRGHEIRIVPKSFVAYLTGKDFTSKGVKIKRPYSLTPNV